MHRSPGPGIHNEDPGHARWASAIWCLRDRSGSTRWRTTRITSGRAGFATAASRLHFQKFPVCVPERVAVRNRISALPRQKPRTFYPRAGAGIARIGPHSLALPCWHSKNGYRSLSEDTAPRPKKRRRTANILFSDYLSESIDQAAPAEIGKTSATTVAWTTGRIPHGATLADSDEKGPRPD